jgi:hypothetical protein
MLPSVFFSHAWKIVAAEMPACSPRRGGIEAILGIAAAVHNERVVERADLQRPRRERRLFPHHDSSDDDDAKRKGEGQAQHPPDNPSSARRLADGGIAGPNRHASIMAGGYALEENFRRLARATGGFALVRKTRPLPHGFAACQRGSCHPGPASPTGPAGTVTAGPEPRSFSPACH